STAGTMVASITCGPDRRATMAKMASFDGSPWCTANMTFLGGGAQKRRRAGAGRREPLRPNEASLQVVSPRYRSRAPAARALPVGRTTDPARTIAVSGLAPSELTAEAPPPPP